MRTKDLTPETIKEFSELLDNQRTNYLKCVSVYIKASKICLLLYVIIMILLTILIN
jgi:hypothetical protein